MNVARVNYIVSQLDYNWFKKKKKFFSNEPFYKKTSALISNYVDSGDTVNIDLKSYCWSSILPWDYIELHEEDYIPKNGPIDSSNVVTDVMGFIEIEIKKFTDPTAIYKVIKKTIEVVEKKVDDLKKIANNPSYSAILDEFVTKMRAKITEEYNHILKQIDILNSTPTLDRKLTPEICAKIAKFKIGNKILITNHAGSVDEGTALMNLLSPKLPRDPNIKIHINDWTNNDVYYLLYRLSQIITDNFSIADIENKKCLYLKTFKLFSKNSFYKFKSKDLTKYETSNPNKGIIDAQLASIF